MRHSKRLYRFYYKNQKKDKIIISAGTHYILTTIDTTETKEHYRVPKNENKELLKETLEQIAMRGAGKWQDGYNLFNKIKIQYYKGVFK